MKIRKTQKRIKEWVDFYGKDGVYVSFSGGKDSTVLLDIVRQQYPEMEAVYIDTGLEYPEIRQFVKTFENITVIRPKKNFKQVITEYEYPVISKEVSQTIYEARQQMRNGVINCYRMKKLNGVVTDKDGNLSTYNMPQWKFLLNAPFRISHVCCNSMKKNPAKEFEKHAGKTGIIGTLAAESFLRQQKWEKYGCNAFSLKRPQSCPISFWKNNDILTYIHNKSLSIASVYGEITPDDSGQLEGQTNIYDYTNDYRGCKFKTTGLKATGCMFCLFGAHLEKGMGRMERMRKTHAERYKYVMGGGEMGADGMWVPNNQGLGFRFVIDWLNENGNLNIRY
ncbi:MAG: phosphoadenosine phosphosulfate reductase family protein [[Clostridium] symbiosum]